MSTPTGPLAVTGATGRLGGRIARLLARDRVRQLLVARDPARLPDLPGAEHRGPAGYGDTAAMQSALTGAGSLLLVSGNLSGRRLAEHASAIDAARRAGLDRVVYVSLLGAARDATYLNARDHAQTEDYLTGSGLRWTVLRPSFYAAMLPGLAVDGVIRGPAGDGRVSAVGHDDIAEVAVQVLRCPDDRFDGRILAVTGPVALTLAEAAAEVSAASGRPVRYQPETVEDAYRWRRRLDASEDQVEGWVSWYQAIAAGEVAQVTDVVRQVTGHPARTVGQVLRGS